MEQDRQLDLALWRFGVISPLLHREANDIGLGEMLSQMTLKSYVHPDGKIIELSPETIRKWLYRFNQGGLPALENKKRSDKGCYDLPKALVEVMFDLRKKHPRWSLALLLSELIKDGHWDGLKPSRSSLYRFARDRNLMRDPHLQTGKQYRSFAFEKFGQLWMADFLHGPKLHIKRKKHKTYLHAIIAYSSESGHPFRSKAATCSDSFRPPNPVNLANLRSEATLVELSYLQILYLIKLDHAFRLHVNSGAGVG